MEGPTTQRGMTRRLIQAGRIDAPEKDERVPTRIEDDQYYTLHPTKGWRRVSNRRAFVKPIWQRFPWLLNRGSTLKKIGVEGSVYGPHQGKKEILRRQRRAAANG